MADRDHSDHISRLSDSDLESLYKSLIALKETDMTVHGSSMSVDMPNGLSLGLDVSGWKPDLKPVDKALDRVNEEIIERELLRE